MLNDFKFAFRRLLKSPGFTVVAIITLALGIGANAVMYSMVRDMVLRPLARDEHHHLVAVYTSRPGPNPDYRMFSYAEYSAVRESKEVFSDVAAMCFDVGAIGPRDTLRRSLICFVSENYFSILGVHPFAGRFFSTSEAKADAGIPVVVASYEFWRRMGKAPDFVGSKVEIDRRSFTVIGIAPAGFGGLHTSISPDVWLPLGAISPAFGHAQLRDAHSYRLGLVASLHPDLTMDLARSRISAVEGRLNALGSSAEPRQILLAPPPRFSLWESAPNDESILSLFAGLAMGLSATVLLVACLNLANLLLARGSARQKEIAICLSIGATRTQIVRLLLVEGLLLAIVGGALGLLLCQWCGNLFQGYARSSFREGTFNFTTQPPLDISVVAGAFVLSLVATAVFSLAPALRATRVNPVDDLKQQPGEPARGELWNRFFSFRHCLVMAQIALSLMLLFSAGLFIRGSLAASRRYPGFQTVDGVVANLDYSFSGLSADAILRRQQSVMGRVSSLPGVARVAMASSVPYNFESSYQRVFTSGERQSNGADDKAVAAAPYAATTLVTNGYFRTLGIPILRGREFTALEAFSSGVPQVAVIDDLLAKQLFGSEDAIGRRIVLNSPVPNEQTVTQGIEVVGIVHSPHEDVIEEAAPRRVYRPLGQAGSANMYLHVETTSPGIIPAVLDQLHRELPSFDSDSGVFSIKPISVFVDKNINQVPFRLAAIVFGGFGAMAFFLAVVGVYGVKAYAVSRRIREVGIRLALGARPYDVFKLILKQGAMQTAIGVLGGVILALLAGLALSRMLFQVSPADPFVLLVSAVLISVAALIACFVPARRAARTDSTIALRSE